jgi:hypothetical protein
MKTIPTQDLLLQSAKRAGQKHYEKFRQECIDRMQKKRAAKERKDKEAEKMAESADNQ